MVIGIIIVILLVGGIGYYISLQSTRPAISQPAQQAATSSQNKFRLADIKIGDTIGEMKVMSIEVPNDKDTLSSYNALIKFKGRVTVSGTYNYDPDSLGSLTTFTVDSSSAEKIPVLTDGTYGNLGTPIFSFTNRDFEWKMLNLRNQSKGGKGTATIIIDNFSIRRDEGEGWPTAELIAVIKKSPTTPLSPLSSNEFTVLDVSDGIIKKGNTVAGMKITAIDPFTSEYKISDWNLVVSFKGKAIVSGKYRYRFSVPPLYGTSNYVCFIPDDADDKKIPKLYSYGTYFCFSNQDLAKENFGGEGSGGEATIEIDNYKIWRTSQEYPNDVPNQAELIRVINKK